MLLKYIKIFWRNILLFAIIIALVIVSSKTQGKTSTITATLAGVVMIYLAAKFILYIIKTPIKTEKDEAA